jgi:hypothetical protein
MGLTSLQRGQGGVTVLELGRRAWKRGQWGTGSFLKSAGAQGEEERGKGGVRLGPRPRRERRGSVRARRLVGIVDRHGTDAVALGCSDSGGWHTPHGRGRHGAGVTDTRDQGEAGPGGSDRGVRERKKEREAGRQGGTNMQARAAQCWTARFKFELNRSKFKWIQFDFKFFQTFLDPNSTFLGSKNLK